MASALAALLLALAPTHASAECLPGPVLAIDWLGGGDEEVGTLAELTGLAPPEAGLIRRGGHRTRQLCAGAERLAWPLRLTTSPPPPATGSEPPGTTPAPASPSLSLTPLPFRLLTTWNGGYPTSGNDGLLWAGRGLSTLASPGLAGRLGPVSFALAPEVAWQQNDRFQTAPGSAGRWDSSPWYGASLDLPQRFGAGPFATASLGQSYLRLDLAGVAVGVSSENLWWGPGVRNALLFTSAGPGVPHAFLGTSRPVETAIGRLEAQALWGELARSASFSGGGHPWLTALAVSWQPRWVPGLALGAGRSFVESARSLRDDHFLTVLEGLLKSQVRGGDNPQDNQLAALWLRWVFPESGLELHAEWGRDDFPISTSGLVREPDRTAAWVAGLQKVFPTSRGHLRLQAEAADLHAFNSPTAIGGLPAWYTHGGDLGYSYRGQPIGASIGPGGDSQLLAVDLLGPDGRLGAFVERIRRNEEVFWAVIEPQGRDSLHDVEMVYGVRGLHAGRVVEASWELSFAFRYNRDFGANERNLHLGVELRWPTAVAPPAP